MPTTLPIIQPRDIPQMRLAEYYNVYHALLLKNTRAKCWSGFPPFFEEQMRDDTQVSRSISSWVSSFSDTFARVGRLGYDIPDDKAAQNKELQAEIEAAKRGAISAFVALAAQLREIAARS